MKECKSLAIVHIFISFTKLFSESLYRGLPPVLVSLFASNFVYFYTFHGLRAVYASDRTKQSALKDLMLGAIAGQSLNNHLF